MVTHLLDWFVVAVSLGEEAMSVSSRGVSNLASGIGVIFALMLALPAVSNAQQRDNPDGEWRYQSADAWGTRYSSVDQINGENFEDLGGGFRGQV